MAPNQNTLHKIFYPPPPVGSRQTVGLFGGSFDPPHQGHLQLAQTALTRLNLDWLWWLVSPQNPNKDTSPQNSLTRRLFLSCALTRNTRKIRVCACDAYFGVTTTYRLIACLQRRFPEVHFLLLIGADNLENFHRWFLWEKILTRLPLCIIDRPGSSFSPVYAKTAQRFQKFRHRYPVRDFTQSSPPAWLFLSMPKNARCSTALRMRIMNRPLSKPGFSREF